MDRALGGGRIMDRLCLNCLSPARKNSPYCSTICCMEYKLKVAEGPTE